MRKTVFLVCLLLFHSSLGYAQRDPFKIGNETELPSLEEVQSSARWLENAVEELREALLDVSPKDFAAAERNYLQKITDILLRPAVNRVSTKLFLLIALNQGLKLATGLPTPDGKRIRPPGATLRGSTAYGLPTVLLEESIRLGTAFYHEDRKTLESIRKTGNFKLPYLKFALAKAKFCARFLPNVMNLSIQFRFGRTCLEQWMAIAARGDNIKSSVIGLEVRDIRKFLTEGVLKAPHDALRELRELTLALPGRIRKSLEKFGLLDPKKKEKPKTDFELTHAAKLRNLREGLESPDSNRRQAVCAQIAQIEGHEPKDLLIRALGDSCAFVSAEAYNALIKRTLEKKDISKLVTAARGASELSKVNIVRILAKIGTSEAFSAVIEFLMDPSYRVRIAAYRKLSGKRLSESQISRLNRISDEPEYSHFAKELLKNT